MKRRPNAITLNGKTYASGSRVRSHLGEATISALYEPHANDPVARAMIDRGEGVNPRLRFPIVALEKLELV
jgi:hypothetical protein